MTIGLLEVGWFGCDFREVSCVKYLLVYCVVFVGILLCGVYWDFVMWCLLGFYCMVFSIIILLYIDVLRHFSVNCIDKS